MNLKDTYIPTIILSGLTLLTSCVAMKTPEQRKLFLDTQKDEYECMAEKLVTMHPEKTAVAFQKISPRVEATTEHLTSKTGKPECHISFLVNGKDSCLYALTKYKNSMSLHYFKMGKKDALSNPYALKLLEDGLQSFQAHRNTKAVKATAPIVQALL